MIDTTTQCCDGTGWYAKSVPFGHPDFGKLFRCECGRAGDPVARQSALREQLKAYADCTFDTWNEQRRLAAHTWGGVTYAEAQQRKALSIATRIAKDYASNPTGGLFIFGSFGAGKTHLAAAIGNECADNNLRVQYYNIPTLFTKMRSASGSFSVDEMLAPLLTCDVLILDDIGSEDVTSFIHGRLFSIIDERLHKATVVTSNVELDKLEDQIGGRIHSRLQLARQVWLPVSDYRKNRQ